VRDGNLLLFTNRGLQDFLTLRRALLSRWGIGKEDEEWYGQELKRLEQGDARQRAQARVSLEKMEQLAQSDQRDLVLSELNSRLKEEDAVRGPGAGGGEEASSADPGPDAIRSAVPE
jgi:hypothetical protein